MLSRREFVQSASSVTAVTAAVGMAASGPGVQAAQPPARAAAKYRLGIVTYNIAAAWDVPTILRVCRNVGLAAVELRTTHKHGVEPSLSAAQRKEVRQRFADAGVTIWGAGTVCEFQSADAAVVKQNIETCRRFVELVADLGGKGVKVRPNGLPAKATKDQARRVLEQIGKALVPCGQAAADAGIEIWVEVHGAGTAMPANMRTIMDLCNHKSVGITWNSNATDVTNGSVAEAFKLLRPWIKSCHINELHSGYPYRELFRLLREMGYDRYTLAEIPGTPDVSSGERLMRYYKMLWTELVSA
jgi:sugar phosphate isomerase/epimerase